MGLSSAMEAGKAGLTIYRVATEVTSENIANVNTPGYSRQRVLLESAPPTTANGFPLGSGVRIASVERYYDSLLQKQLATAQTTQGYDTTKSNVLQQVEPTFNEIATDGLGAAITNFFGAWQDLSLNPSGTTERQTIISRANQLVDNFHAVSTALTDTITTQNESLDPLVKDINSTLQSIAKLNGQIKYTEQVNGNANEIRDQRDQLIQDLSSQIGITFKENTDGTTDVAFADTGAALVTGTQYGSFALAQATPTSPYTINLTDAAGATATGITPVSGQLGAIVDLRDNVIPGYLDQVNALATTIATQVNNQQAAGFDQSGPPGVAGIPVFTFSAIPNTAANIAVNSSLTSSNIAASGSATLTGDNSNALAMAQLQNTNQTFTAGVTTTFNKYYDTLVSTVGLDVQSSKNTVAQDEAFTKQLSALRDSKSGVSLDEELTNLIKYQRSYQACAKIISTASDMMDVAINMVR